MYDIVRSTRAPEDGHACRQRAGREHAEAAIGGGAHLYRRVQPHAVVAGPRQQPRQVAPRHPSPLQLPAAAAALCLGAPRRYGEECGGGGNTEHGGTMDVGADLVFIN